MNFFLFLQCYVKLNASDLILDQPNITFYDFKVCLPHDTPQARAARDVNLGGRHGRFQRDVKYIINDNKWLLIINETYTKPPGIYIGVDIIGRVLSFIMEHSFLLRRRWICGAVHVLLLYYNNYCWLFDVLNVADT